jgi:hypothetical protein
MRTDHDGTVTSHLPIGKAADDESCLSSAPRNWSTWSLRQARSQSFAAATNELPAVVSTSTADAAQIIRGPRARTNSPVGQGRVPRRDWTPVQQPLVKPNREI